MADARVASTPAAGTAATDPPLPPVYERPSECGVQRARSCECAIAKPRTRIWSIDFGFCPERTLNSASRLTCEESLKLDLAEPVLHALLDLRCGKVGRLHWSSVGADIAATEFFWSASHAQLTLSCISDGAPLKQTIQLTSTRPYFGGRRWWFVCPETGRRARVLFFPPGARRWASRPAHGLAYGSQRASGLERALKRLVAGDERGIRRAATRRAMRLRRSL